jgi:hypothetical protein
MFLAAHPKSDSQLSMRVSKEIKNRAVKPSKLPNLLEGIDPIACRHPCLQPLA